MSATLSQHVNCAPDAQTIKPTLRLAVIGLRGMPDVIGGIETHCALIYPLLAAEDHDLDIQVLARSSYMPARTAQLGRVNIRALWAPRTSGLEALVHTGLALLYTAVRIRPHIVHIHGIGPALFSPLARVLGLKVIVTHHAADFMRPKWGWAARTSLRLGEKLAARFAHRVICVSATLQAEFLARNPNARDRTITIRHGIEAPSETISTPDAFLESLGLVRGNYAIVVGRIDETKRLDDLIAAHAAAGPDVQPLVIVGAATAASRYEECLRATAGPGVHFIGYHSGEALAAIYAGASLLIHPSEMEGFGLVILEALNAGVPTFVSDIPVHREFGLPEDHYFDVGDVPAITRIMTMGVRRKMPWPPAKPIVARHRISLAVRAYSDLIRQVARGTARQAQRVAAKTPSKVSQ